MVIGIICGYLRKSKSKERRFKHNRHIQFSYSTTATVLFTEQAYIYACVKYLCNEVFARQLLYFLKLKPKTIDYIKVQVLSNLPTVMLKAVYEYLVYLLSRTF